MMKTDELMLLLNYSNIVDNDDIVDEFIEKIYEFIDSHPDLHLNQYSKILEKNNLKWDDSLKDANPDELDIICLLAMIVAIVRADRIYEGTLNRYIRDKTINRWLTVIREKAEQ